MFAGIYYELLDINKDASSEKYETMFNQFMEDVQLFQTSMEEWISDKQRLVEKNQELEEARKRLKLQDYIKSGLVGWLVVIFIEVFLRNINSVDLRVRK